MKKMDIAKGRIIYLEEQPASHIYVIKKGKVEIKKSSGYFCINRKMQKSIVLVEGDVFGFEEVLTKSRRRNKASALEDCEILYFEEAEFAEVIKNNVKIGEKILKSLSGRIRGINHKIKKMTIPNTEEEDEENHEEKIHDIFFYFLKAGMLEQAAGVLGRMAEQGINKEFAEKQKKRIVTAIADGDIDEILRIDNESDREVVEILLIGLKKRIENKYEF